MSAPVTITDSADISECGTFRWTLTRRWADGPVVCFVMLNPSTATATIDDPTIRRCMTFAKAWGFGSLLVLNLYPYRATKPKDLKNAMRRIDVTGGTKGQEALRKATEADLVIAAWGSHASQEAKDRFFRITAPKPIWCIDTNGDLTPVHPLYQKGDKMPKPFYRSLGLDWRDCLKGTNA